MDCRQTTEHLAGGREGLTCRDGREEFSLEKKDGRPCRGAAAETVADGDNGLGGGDGGGGDGYDEGDGSSANCWVENTRWRGESTNDYWFVSCV